MGDATNYLRGAAGAVVGAVLGVAAFIALYEVGLAAHALIGAGAGWGAQWGYRGRSPAMGALTALVALVATVIAAWSRAWFLEDDSLLYYALHLFELPIGTLIMIALSVAIAYWMGQGRGGYA